MIGLDFDLSEDEHAFQLSVREFCALEVAPRVVDIDTDGAIPEAVIEGLASQGLLAPLVDDAYGGAGRTTMEALLAAMELGRADLSLATAVYYLHNAAWSAVLEMYGANELCEEVLPAVTNGHAFLGVASTEPTGGSDVANINSYADPSPEGGGYILTGRKSYISGIAEAERLGGASGHLTIAKTTLFGGAHGLGLFYVPITTPGIKSGLIENMGRQGISAGTLLYNEVSLPTHYRLDRGDRGFFALLGGFHLTRILISGACIGFAEAMLERGVRHVKKRQAFGRPIGKFEAIQFELADLYARLEHAKLAVCRAAWLRDRLHALDRSAADRAKEAERVAAENSPLQLLTGVEETQTERQRIEGRFIRSVATAKLVAPQIAFDIVKAVMLWHGALGYTKALGLERGMRGIMSSMIGAEGTLNMMRIILGRELLGNEYVPYR